MDNKIIEELADTKEALERSREMNKYLNDTIAKLGKRDFSSITRVEVIDPAIGRAYVNHNVRSTELSIQDEGRTLKIFLT